VIAAPGKYYVYAVIDQAESPAALLAVRRSRQEARLVMKREQAEGAPATLRVRRAKLTLFET
jgi:hypothetical protein